MNESDLDVAVVGAGLAGLACAAELQAAGQSVVILEASDGVGGRVRTDVIDGYRLDRGFQVLLTAYPELPRHLDLDALKLRAFDPGALVWTGSRFHRFADPLRMPRAIAASAVAPLGSPIDKVRLAIMMDRLRRADPVALLQAAERSTADALRASGYSELLVDRFLRPLLGGIQLDSSLSASSRMSNVVLRCLATGQSVVPALGMGELAAQMHRRLASGTVRLRSAATAIRPGTVTLADGSTVRASSVVVATEGPAASTLLGLPAVGSRSVSCVWFAASAPPTNHRLIVLDGSRSGPASNVAVMSNVAPEYAPDGGAVIAAACLGPTPTAQLTEAVRRQLTSWWGPQVSGWRHLRTDSIVHALPDHCPPFNPKRRVSLGEGLYVCGDHRDTPSIQGALYSGRRTAEAILASGT